MDLEASSLLFIIHVGQSTTQSIESSYLNIKLLSLSLALPVQFLMACLKPKTCSTGKFCLRSLRSPQYTFQFHQLVFQFTVPQSDSLFRSNFSRTALYPKPARVGHFALRSLRSRQCTPISPIVVSIHGTPTSKPCQFRV